MEKKILNFGIVGTNFISDAFARAALLSQKCSALAIYSRSEVTGREFAKKHGIKKVYTNFDTMLADSEIDAVYIASPSFLHKEMAVKTLLSGKDALIEKIISINHDEFLEIAEAQRATGKIFLEAMRPDFDKAFSLIEELLPSLGKVLSAELEFCKYSSRYDNFKRGIVENAFEPKLKNSALADLGIYPLHLAVRLFGEPEDVFAKSNFLENGFEAEGVVTLAYPDYNVTVRYSKIYDGKNTSCIICENGEISFGKINEPKTLSIIKRGEEMIKDFTPESNNILTEIDAFCDTVMGCGDYLRLSSVSEKTMKLVDKIYERAGITFPKE